MSNIEKQIDAGTLQRCVPPLLYKDQHHRLLYMSTESAEWCEDVLKWSETDGFTSGADKPIMQFLTIARRYCSGFSFEPPLPHHMRPEKRGIWRLRTADVRIVGWFIEKEVFIISEMDLKRNCSNIRDEELLNNAIRLRSSLNIDGGKYLEGELDECI